ncbi:MAG TPA: pyridoxamine 5'-phosphate oxidase family protein [Gemmatimonadaceae bacterium]|jgi:nitroimidazol reductase NimA-like FMN-containing flavoprotein (pyridoxamine 5'-phosphate oxidase superfamily)|nr:pyridoxamine 5'-phosphate oxidase family protein [Gemmatimonadaceae bacterium]
MKATPQRTRGRSSARRSAAFTASACAELLEHNCFGHLVLARGTHVDAVPIRYVFADGWLYFGAASSLRTAIDHNVWVALAVALPTERGRWVSVVARGACYATEHTGTAVADAAALRGIIRLRKQGPSTSGGAHRKTRSSIIFRMHVEELRGRMVRAPCPPAER